MFFGMTNSPATFYMMMNKILINKGKIAAFVDDMLVSSMERNRNGVAQSGRNLTTKVGNNLGLSSCAVPQSSVTYVVTYFRRTELLSGVQERSGID